MHMSRRDGIRLGTREDGPVATLSSLRATGPEQFVRADEVLPEVLATRYATMVEDESTQRDRPARTPASHEPTPRPTAVAWQASGERTG